MMGDNGTQNDANNRGVLRRAITAEGLLRHASFKGLARGKLRSLCVANIGGRGGPVLRPSHACRLRAWPRLPRPLRHSCLEGMGAITFALGSIPSSLMLISFITRACCASNVPSSAVGRLGGGGGGHKARCRSTQLRSSAMLFLKLPYEGLPPAPCPSTS